MDDQLIYKEIVMNKHKIHFEIQMFQIMIPKDPLKEKIFSFSNYLIINIPILGHQYFENNLKLDQYIDNFLIILHNSTVNKIF
jgi:hypothetical protein